MESLPIFEHQGICHPKQLMTLIRQILTTKTNADIAQMIMIYIAAGCPICGYGYCYCDPDHNSDTHKSTFTVVFACKCIEMFYGFEDKHYSSSYVSRQYFLKLAESNMAYQKIIKTGPCPNSILRHLSEETKLTGYLNEEEQRLVGRIIDEGYVSRLSIRLKLRLDYQS